MFICIYLCCHHLYFILVHIFHCVPALPYILLANGQNYTVVVLWIVFRQYLSRFIEFLIIMVNILQMGCLKLTKLYDND